MASRKRSISSDADVSDLYKEWDEASCPICMDHPHNAVLLICSSHDKGCRSYICDTSYRHSNCLDRFKKLKEENSDSFSGTSLLPGSSHDSTGTSSGNLDLTNSSPRGELGGHVNHNLTPSIHDVHNDLDERTRELWLPIDLGETDIEKSEEGSNLRCPLCRGKVLGWKVVEEVRNYLNLKSRSCSRESCSFIGNYRELRRHARRVHPTVRPADVDPSRQRAWRRLEDQREYNDIVSTIRSAMPGAVVVGDYVIESGDRRLGERDRNGGAADGGRWLSTLFLFQMIGSLDPGAELRGGRSRVLPRHRRATGTFSRRRYVWGENLLGLRDENDDNEEDEEDEADLNISSNLGDDGPPNRRRRRRLTRASSDEDNHF
ncbi:uncharacterized protein LOC105165711 isoform X1 [Sesamum indicum]|uniref:Uncharacterized protein LOC105165711 isoform X1 n=2 Tax=Sesamum indicum TaxID=4182 RepID=A0A6I9TDT7_SESIN|nr:uncharacterized protein LOC105165711 isoform X1 [Sesamum indicum]XP_011083113.1 uncharacterized protein LOC105165711 isoform X1 [Sesamum indicum]